MCLNTVLRDIRIPMPHHRREIEQGEGWVSVSHTVLTDRHSHASPQKGVRRESRVMGGLVCLTLLICANKYSHSHASLQKGERAG